MIADKRDVQVKENYDLIVVGGGIAGVAAAVSASRNGLSVLLIEKQINLGGLATTGLISWYEPLCDGKGRQMIFGIAQELIRLSGKYSFDNLPRQWGGDEKNRESGRYATRFSPTVFSLALDEFVTNHGVTLRFDTLAVYPVMERNRCTGVICESVSGKEFFGCQAVADATGTAVIAERAGMPTVAGQNYMTYLVHLYQTEMSAELSRTGDVCKFRKWVDVGSDMFGNGHPEGMKMLRGDSAQDVTDYVLYGKREMLARCKGMDRNGYDIMTLPAMPQFRTIRRIAGAADFTAEDGRQYADSIGICGDFRPDGAGKHYEIPYRALYHADFPNIFACGRIISAPQGDGWEIARVIPNCALTGEAAGNAAALTVKNRCAAAEVEVAALQKLQQNNEIQIH